jgi:hypothetical protein
MPLVPVGRLPSLDKEIKSLEDRLRSTKKRIQHLEPKKAKYGIDFPVSDAIDLEERIEEAKKLALEIKVLETERELQKQYETELVAVAPIHMVLAIAQKGRPTTYVDTLAMCEKIMKPLFDEHSLLLGYSGDMLARQFQARADLESQKSGQQISAKALIEREIKDLKDLAPYHKDALLLGYREDSLGKAKDALESDQQPVSFSLVPADPIARALPQFPGSDGGPGICFEIDKKRRLKITVLHQPLAEDQGKSILIYESYSETTAMVRVVCNYWKAWSSGKFNFSEAPELHTELSKLSDACSHKIEKLCCAEIAGYRLPYCIMFLSAFDEHERSDGLHIPICLALQSTVMEEDQHVLRAEDVQNKSISHLVFVELFKREMLGSGWLNREWLLDLHKFLMTLLPPGTPIILTQEYSYPAQEDGTKEAAD